MSEKIRSSPSKSLWPVRKSDEEKSSIRYSTCSDRITEKIERKEICILKEHSLGLVQLKPPKGDEQDIE